MVGTDQRFPIHRVYCVGRNYADHAIEMGHDPVREPPFFFQKNPDNLIPSGGEFPYPPQTKDVHHEIETVVAIGKGGTDIPVERALDHVYGYAVGARHDPARPPGGSEEAWSPMGGRQGVRGLRPLLGRGAGEQDRSSDSRRRVAEGQRRAKQNGDLNQLIWKVPEMIAYLSTLFDAAAR